MGSWILPVRAIVVQAKEMIALLPILYLFFSRVLQCFAPLIVAYLLCQHGGKNRNSLSTRIRDLITTPLIECSWSILFQSIVEYHT